MYLGLLGFAVSAAAQVSVGDDVGGVEAIRGGQPGLPSVPALVPADPALRESALVTRGDGWTAVAMHSEGLGVFVQGNAVLVERPELAYEIGAMGDGPTLTRNEGTVHVSFWRDGIAFTLMVECASPFGDERCTGDDYALGLVESLAEVSQP